MNKLEPRDSYWEKRGMLSFLYKGEAFYTVTPIPYYYRRRSLLLELMKPIIGLPQVATICDFGCGDGWYVRYFSDVFKNKSWCGLDVSDSMLEKAKLLCPKVKFALSDKSIPFEQKFDAIYAITVFAHIMNDSDVIESFKYISAKLEIKGYCLLFEQTGTRKSGSTYCTRAYTDYIDYANHVGLSLESQELISFPAHRFFEKIIAPCYRRFFSKGTNNVERCINANKSLVYRFLSRIMLLFSILPIKKNSVSKNGYTFYVFRKY